RSILDRPIRRIGALVGSVAHLGGSLGALGQACGKPLAAPLGSGLAGGRPLRARSGGSRGLGRDTLLAGRNLATLGLPNLDPLAAGPQQPVAPRGVSRERRLGRGWFWRPDCP